jgi:hypothetical protein
MINYQIKYNRLESLVKAYLVAQEEYHKSKRDNYKFRVMMVLQKHIKEFITPKVEKTLFDISQ